MRRVLSFVLAVLIVMSLACTAFAAPSAGNESGTGGACAGGKDHSYKNGVCTVCGEKCSHEFRHGKCVECGIVRYVPSGSHSSGSNPKTGDVAMPWFVVMLSTMTALTAVAVVNRKKQA